MKSLLIFIPVSLLVGCTCNPTKPIEAQVAVPVNCKIPTIPKPTMPLDSAKPSDDLLTKTKLSLAEIELRKAYELKLETAIKACQ